jgi:hypothetical protein
MSVGSAVFLSLFVLLFLAVGILIVVVGVRQIRDGRSARSWPTVDARLEQCAVERTPRSGQVTWHVALKYTYCVAGVPHAGTTLAIGAGGTSSRKRHEKERRRVLAMEPFMIRYHPDRPDMSAIFLSTTTQMYWVFFMGVFWLAGTSCFALIVLSVSGARGAVGP